MQMFYNNYFVGYSCNQQCDQISSKTPESNGNCSVNGENVTKYVNATSVKSSVRLTNISTHERCSGRVRGLDKVREMNTRSLLRSSLRDSMRSQDSTSQPRSHEHKLRTRLMPLIMRSRMRSSHRSVGRGYWSLFRLSLSRKRTSQRRKRKYGYKGPSQSVTSSFSYLPYLPSNDISIDINDSHNSTDCCHENIGEETGYHNRRRRRRSIKNSPERYKRINDVPLVSEQHRSLRVCTCS